MRMRPLLVTMAAVAIAFAAVIWFGFWIHTKTDSIPDNVFAPIAYIAIFGIALLLTCWMLGISPRSGWTVQEMFNPPKVRRRPQVAKVRPPSAAQMAYLRNRNATVTCAHLEPLERAMRTSGIEVRLLENGASAPIIKAACRINEGELRRVFQLPPSVSYREGYEPDRGESGNPRADIICGYCQKTDRARCDILVLHPDEWRADTPWFPAPPS
jgi:hypothetical protein